MTKPKTKPKAKPEVEEEAEPVDRGPGPDKAVTIAAHWQETP